MRFTLSSLLLIAAAAHAQSLSPELARLLEVKNRASLLLANVPNYTCLETFGRVERSAQGRQKSADVIRLAVAVIDGKETYGWPDGGRFLDRQLSQMIPAGLRATGLYGTFAIGLMAGNNNDFQFAGEDRLNGESAFRYDFRIPAAEGPWNIQVGKESGTAGERGSFWVAAKNLDLRRLEVSALDVPAHLGLQNLHLVIDYEVMTISDRRVLLPAKAWVDARDWTGKEDFGHVFFNHCRAFEAESTLSFPSEAQAVSQPKLSPGKLELPTGLEITALLQTPVDSAASPGDLLTATVAQPVYSKGKEIVSQGARLEGHIRQIRPLPDSGECAVTIEFDRIQAFGGWVQFYARMTAFGDVRAVRHRKGHPLFDAAPDVGGGQGIVDPEIPGVVTIYLPVSSAQMPAATSMAWKTEDIMPAKDRVSPNLDTRIPMN